jgi:hypothetical protein
METFPAGLRVVADVRVGLPLPVHRTDADHFVVMARPMFPLAESAGNRPATDVPGVNGQVTARANAHDGGFLNGEAFPPFHRLCGEHIFPRRA